MAACCGILWMDGKASSTDRSDGCCAAALGLRVGLPAACRGGVHGGCLEQRRAHVAGRAAHVHAARLDRAGHLHRYAAGFTRAASQLSPHAMQPLVSRSSSSVPWCRPSCHRRGAQPVERLSLGHPREDAGRRGQVAGVPATTWPMTLGNTLFGARETASSS